MNVRTLLLLLAFGAIVSVAQTSSNNEADTRPPVTVIDLKIARRASEILDSPSKWNRADTRVCPAEAKTFSLYCALEKATNESGKHFEHRSAAMQEARFVIEEVNPNWKRYEHRLKDYNNDPNTTFADIQRVFQLLEDHIAQRLKEQERAGKK